MDPQRFPTHTHTDILQSISRLAHPSSSNNSNLPYPSHRDAPRPPTSVPSDGREQKRPLWKAISLHPCCVCSKTASLESHFAAPLWRLLKNCFSGKPFRCTPVAFAQTQPLWNAISLHPCRVCSKASNKKHVQSVQYAIHNTMHSTQYTVHGSQYTSHSIQYTVCSLQYEVYSTQYTVYSTQCTIQNIQHTVHSIQYTVQQYTVHNTHCNSIQFTVQRKQQREDRNGNATHANRRKGRERTNTASLECHFAAPLSRLLKNTPKKARTKCTVYSTQYSAQYTVYSTRFTIYITQYTVHNMQHTVRSIQYTLHSI